MKFPWQAAQYTTVIAKLRSRMAHLYGRIKGKITRLLARPVPQGPLPIPIIRAVSGGDTATSIYWNDHTVRSQPFANAPESAAYVDWIDRTYPLYHQFMKLYAGYDDQVVVDYGCGPANDLVGFVMYSNARKVIGIDVSEKALRLASYRLGLHGPSPGQVELILISDSVTGTPLADNSVDHIHSQGVLHHTTNPGEILKVFYRILKPGGRAHIMVYNYYSVFVHLHIGYNRMIVQNAFPGADLETAFSKSTDGESCPISRYYHYPEFIALCNEAGFSTEFVGGYLSTTEIDGLAEQKSKALNDPRLPEPHRKFLTNLSLDSRGYPMYQGKYAGIGGVFRLHKPVA
jgi:SAM-dependent methyltransferase